jgi:starvation-inducible outer membrane lipoprotein
MKHHLMIAIAIILAGCSTSPKKIDTKSVPPKLLKPVVKKIWIPEEMRNGGAEWVEGHYMYRIEQETTWSR